MSSVDTLVADLIGGDEAAAEAAVARLAERGESAVTSVLALLGSPESEHRWWAVRTLAAMPSPRTEWFIDALRDPEAEVRAAAALALAAHPHGSAGPSLVRALSDNEHLVGLLAVNASVKIGAPIVPLLLDAFDGAPQRGRIHIMRALAEVRDPRSIQLMMACLAESSAALQYWAQEGLERLGLNMVYMRPH